MTKRPAVKSQRFLERTFANATRVEVPDGRMPRSISEYISPKMRVIRITMENRRKKKNTHTDKSQRLLERTFANATMVEVPDGRMTRSISEYISPKMRVIRITMANRRKKINRQVAPIQRSRDEG